MMRVALILTCVLSGLAPAGAAGRDAAADAVAAAIAEAVRARMGAAARVDVELLQMPEAGAGPFSATTTAGARLGAPIRFILAPATGRAFGVVARVHVIAPHVVARRAVSRDAEFSESDVAWTEGLITDLAIEPLPTLGDVVASRSRRAVAEGEIVSATLLRRPVAVRAGEPVAMTIRSGAIVARGVGRAVNSGAIGDVIRVLRPGSRQPSQARIIAPAAVEILQ